MNYRSVRPEYRLCPNCNKEIYFGWLRCPYCEFDLAKEAR